MMQYQALAKISERQDDDELKKEKYLSIDPHFESVLDPNDWSNFANNYLTYFDEISEDGLYTQSFSRELQEIWFQTLKHEMQNVCISPRRIFFYSLTDFPWPVDDHFIPFSVFRYILFAFYFFTTPQSRFQVKRIADYVKNATRDILSVKILWRLLWFFCRTDESRPRSSMDLSSRPKSPFYSKNDPFSILKDYEMETKLRGDVPKLISEVVSRGKQFPLNSKIAVDEDTMKFIRVLHWVHERALKLTDFSEDTIIDLLLLNKPVSLIKDAYNQISICSGYDGLLVRHCKLQYDTILRQKRDIENAEDGTAFAIKLPKTVSYEDELDFLQWRLNLWKGRKHTILEKILNIKLEISSCRYTTFSRSAALHNKLESKKEILQRIEKKIEDIQEKKKYLLINFKV